MKWGGEVGRLPTASWPKTLRKPVSFSSTAQASQRTPDEVAHAALGALVAGYLTPARPPVLPGAAESVDTSPLDVGPIALPAPPPSPRRLARRRPAAQHRPSGHA